MRPILAACCFCLGLAGCASPSITLMGRSTGDVGAGSVEGVWFGNSGPIEIALRDEVYRGTWVAVRNPGTTQFALLNAYSSTGASASGTAWGLSRSDSGFGSAILQSPSGAGLRCEYQYSTVTVTATGICQHEDGEIFDFQAG